MPATRKKKIVAWVAPDVHAKLQALAIAQERSVAAIIRAAIRAELNAAAGTVSRHQPGPRVAS